MEAQSCGTSCTPSWPALCVAVAARPWYRLLRPWCLPSFDFSGFSYCGGDKWSCVAQTSPLKGFYLCMTSPTRPTVDENKLGSSRYYLSRGSFLRVWMWQRRIGSALIPLLWCFWLSLGSCLFLDFQRLMLTYSTITLFSSLTQWGDCEPIGRFCRSFG
jgi:hypothetical protein